MWIPFGSAGCDYFIDAVRSSQCPQNIIGQLEKYNTPRKVRYLTEFLQQKIFEVTFIEDYELKKRDLPFFDELKKNVSSFDMIIAFDFGHGLFEGERLNNFKNIKKFKSLNVQANSNNFGYNTFTKHGACDVIVLDEREVRLGLQDRYASVDELLNNKAAPQNLMMTLGPRGAMSLGMDAPVPTFINNPIDTTGSGDAFFSVYSLMKYLRYDDEVSAFIGNIHAGLHSKIRGNKTAVSGGALFNFIKGLLS